MRNSVSIWSDISKTAEEAALKHPAMFPAQLVSHLLESLTRSGQTVIPDPFSGIGSTVLAAGLADKMRETGFLLDDLIVWDRKREYNNPRPLGYPSVFRVNRVHEYILIFQKPR